MSQHGAEKHLSEEQLARISTSLARFGIPNNGFLMPWRCQAVSWISMNNLSPLLGELSDVWVETLPFSWPRK